jgi:protein-S-isoprenylcysteine O-methyltransferase Ste14
VIILASGPALGSWLAAVLVISSLPFLLYRAVSEDHVLQAELPGYADYARRVRWRLVPAFGEAEQGFAAPSPSTSLR